MCEKEISKKQRIICYGIIYLTAIYPLHPAWSSAITPSDKNIQISQQNTVPIINIIKPNNHGISHNKFHSFNVGKQGVVLNNATTSVNTQLAKQVNANSHLKGNAAHLIINEVVGNERSQLLGKLEVAGQQSDVLIANPNGITCDGCSFINTPAITLTTGKPLFSPQGAYSAIEVKKGSVVIGTQGIDLQAQNYADIISRRFELNGKINANNLSLMQGHNRIDFDKGTVNSINSEGVKPTLSIDTKALGGMYANQIRLVSTEKGVGVNLSDIQTNQNSVNLTVDGKIIVNGNIQTKKDINISTKELQINNNAKLNAKNDINLATNTLTNHSEIIAEKDMRLFTDKLANKGSKALIKSTDNLWIQKNAKGDPSTLIENQSATIKTEKGDLIIRSKKLVNESITHLYQEIKQDPNSNYVVSIGDRFLNPSENFYRKFIFVNFVPEISELTDKKWFDVLDLRKNGGVNTERTLFIFNKNYTPGVIDSGKNAYIQSNELISDKSKISASNNLILTGSHAKLSHNHLGFLNLWDSYLLENEKFKYNFHFDSEKFNLDIDKFQQEYYPISYKKSGSHYEFVINDNPEYILKSGGSLVLDFKDSISLERKFPVDNNKLKKVKNSVLPNYPVSADNILLNSDNINISLNLKSNNEISILSRKNIDLTTPILYSGESINLIANNDINYSQGALVTKDVSFITRSGNINYSLNPAYSYSHHYFSPPTIFADNSIMFYSGNNIILENIQIKTPNEISLTALGNIFINRDESLLFNLLPEMRKKTSLSDLVSNIGIWESMGDINLTAGKNIVSQGIKYIAGKNITFTTGKDIFLASKPIKDVDPFFANINYPQLRSKIVAKNNILMNAARDIDLTSALIYSNNKVTLFAGQNINLGATNYSALRNPDTDFKNNQNAITTIVADKGITISASEQLVAKGSYFQSEDDITISTGSDMQLGAVQAYSYTESESELEEHHKQVGTVINSGNKITLLSEGSILFQASELKANKEINSFTQGGFLYAQAMEESSYYEEEKKKCNWWTLCATKKKYTKTFYNKNNKVTEFNANGDIHLFAYDDITLEATKVNTKNNASIISKTGSIYFKAVKDVTFKQIITESQDIYITHRNQGYFNETWQLPALHIGGKLTIDAPKIISADVKAQKEESLEQALTILSNTPGYEWLSELQESENVNWNLVKETYSSWDEETQRINPVFGAFIAIGVAIATYGSSLATTVGGMASEVATAAGASAGIASSASVAAQAGFVSLASQAAVSLVENKGDIYKTFKSLGNSDTVKSVFTSMVVAGALHGLDQFMGWDQTIQGGTLPSTGKLLITDNATWSQVAQRVASHSIVSSTLGTAIQGGRFIDNFKIALLSNLGSQFHAEGANLIGNNGEILGHAGKILSHAVIAGVSAEIAGENVNGAIAGAIAAEIAAITINDNLIKTENWREEQAQKSRLIGAFAGLLATGKAEGVFSGANSAELVERFNRQLHVEEIKAVKELANGDNHKLERLLAASCRKTYCIAQESLSSSERIYYESLMKKYPYTHMEDSLLSDYWITKERTRIGGNYPIFSGHEKVKLFTYGDADKLTDSETFAKNQWIENASEVTGWDKKTLENLTTLITVGSSLTRANRIYGSISFKANKTQFVSIKDIYFIDKSGNKITMKWMYQGTPEQQGMTFENYIGLSNKRLTRLHVNAKTFDYYDKDTKEYISVKTLNTQTASRLKNPKAIENTLNTYISKMDNYPGDKKGVYHILQSDIKSKTLELGIPEKTTKEQWDIINNSIKNASGKNIKVNITIIEE